MHCFTGSDDIREIKLAMSEFENYTCIRFRPKTDSDTYWMDVVRGVGCSSNVGFENSQQFLTLAKPCIKVNIDNHLWVALKKGTKPMVVSL